MALERPFGPRPNQMVPGNRQPSSPTGLRRGSPRGTRLRDHPRWRDNLSRGVHPIRLNPPGKPRGLLRRPRALLGRRGNFRGDPRQNHGRGARHLRDDGVGFLLLFALLRLVLVTEDLIGGHAPGEQREVPSMGSLRYRRRRPRHCRGQ